MEVNAKLKEMEEEIKVLKAEIRNVLLDIREVILERTNPLDEAEAPVFRMDLRTTASAVAADAAAREAGRALEAEHEAPPAENGAAAGPEAETETEGHIATLVAEGPEGEPAATAPDEPDQAHEEPEEETADEPPPPKVIRRDPRELKMLAEEKTHQAEPHPVYREEIPPMYRAEVAALSANGSLSAWLSEALQTVGPRELERIIAIQRSWGNLPPNIGRALAHVQELLAETGDEDTSPDWLHVMRELDRIAAL